MRLYAGLSQKVNSLMQTNIPLALLLVLGILFRIYEYLFNRSLWIDEARLALNIVNRSYPQLLNPLDYNQGAPIGFLFAEKLITQIFGNSEYALRLLPFVASIVSLFLFYALIKRILKPDAVIIGLMLYVVSWPLSYYAAEVKQYSSDVMIALLLSLVALSLFKNSTGVRQSITFGIIGGIVIWFSHPAVFVLAGIGGAMGLLVLLDRDWTKLGKLTISYGLWGGSFLIFYLVSLQAVIGNSYLRDFWVGDFMPFPPTSLGQLLWIPNQFLKIFGEMSLLPGVAGVAFIIGLVTLFRRDKQRSLFLVVPIFVTLLVSGLELYPFGDRLILFLVPALLIFIAVGVEEIRIVTWQITPVTSIVFIMVIFFTPAYATYRHLIKYGPIREDSRSAIQYLNSQIKPDDTLYLYYGVHRGWDYYSPYYDFDHIEPVLGREGREDWQVYLDDLEKLYGSKRVWLLFSHVWYTFDEEKFFLFFLDQQGTRLDEAKFRGASVYLYNLENSMISKENNIQSPP